MRLTLPIRGYVTILVIGTVLPFLVFSGLLVGQAASDQRELIARTVRDAANGAAGDLNRQIGALQSFVLALADARSLQTGNLAEFHQQASELVRRQDLTVALYDLTGQQLVNTAVPFGTPLPMDRSMVVEVIETRQPIISDLVRDPRTGLHMISTAVPVMRGTEPVYVLSLQITSAVTAVMLAQFMPPEQAVGLVDRQGTIIYRTRDPQSVIGLQAPLDFLDGTAGRDEGSLSIISRTGVPIYIAYSRVRRADWVLAVSIPQEVLFAPARASQIRLLLLGTGTLALAGLITWLVGRTITRPVAGLSRIAAARDGDRPIVHPPATHLCEVNAVMASVIAEAEQLREQTEQRQQGVAALEAEVANHRHIERQLMQSQKMEAVGQLTGGLAHDFNNLLAIIIGNLDALRERWPDDRESEELTTAALEAALSGADLTRRMLAFARRQPLAPESCDINRVIGSIVRLLRRTLGENVQIELRLAQELWPVLVDRAQFATAITNLATNARDAMPDGGHLTITTQNTELDQDYAAAHSEVTPGRYVLIEVSDNGTGMTSAVLERIFEPFFTTKEPGRGAGLGLSMVFGFLKQSDGHVTADSEPGEGTTFRLYLPPAQEAAPIDTTVALSAPEPGRNETILAVEDSDRLRQILARQLTSAGYRVLEARDAHAALKALESNVGIDLLLTDIVMPGGMNGHELARAAIQRYPRLKTLLTTGFSDVLAVNAPSDLPVLRKRYRKEELLRCVRETLDCC